MLPALTWRKRDDLASLHATRPQGNSGRSQCTASFDFGSLSCIMARLVVAAGAVCASSTSE